MISTDTCANVIQSPPPSQESRTTRPPGARTRLLALGWLGAYLVASAPVLARSSGWIAALHVALVVVIGWTLLSRTEAARRIGDLLPLLVAPLLYAEIPQLIAGAGTGFHDAFVGSIEARLFGGQPSRTWAGRWPITPLSELLHAGYLAYYPAIFAPPLLLFARGRRRAYHNTVLALTVTYTLCWTLYAFFPVQGPRYLWIAPAGIPGGFFRGLAVRILAAGSSRGAAFPSSHMAVSVVQAMMAWRWQPRLAPVLSVVALLVGFGAVYGGFHYATDIVAGGLLGLIIGAAVWRFAE